MDVAAVGADLSPKQQDETLADLTFFMDEFGSTRAVRVKLQEHEREIKRFKQRLMKDGSGDFHKNEDVERGEENTVKGSENATEEADEVMVNLDFFLRTYGSTRAVRRSLERQKGEIMGLKWTFQWLQERWSTTDGSEGSSEMEFVGTQTKPAVSALTLEKRDDKLDGDTSSVDKTDHVDDGDGHEHAGVLDVTAVGEVGGDVEMATLEQENERWMHVAGPLDSSGGDKRMGEVDAVPNEASREVVALRNCETERCADEASEDRRLRPTRDVPSAGNQATGIDRVTVESSVEQAIVEDAPFNVVVAIAPSAQQAPKPVAKHDKLAQQLKRRRKMLCAEKRVEPVQANAVADPSTAVDTSPVSPTTRKERKYRCRFPGCEKLYRVHGLCSAHGGFRPCQIDGCSLKAVTRRLCRQHGGGTRCSINGCEKVVAAGGEGRCYTHVWPKVSR